MIVLSFRSLSHRRHSHTPTRVCVVTTFGFGSSAHLIDTITFVVSTQQTLFVHHTHEITLILVHSSSHTINLLLSFTVTPLTHTSLHLSPSILILSQFLLLYLINITLFYHTIKILTAKFQIFSKIFEFVQHTSFHLTHLDIQTSI